MSLLQRFQGWVPIEIKFWHKIAGICLAFAIPIAVLLYMLVQEQNKAVEFAQKELRGTEYLRPCRSLVEHLLQHRQLLHRQSQGEPGVADDLAKKPLAVEADLKQLEAADRKHGAALSQAGRTTDEFVQKIKEQWQEIRRSDATRKPEAVDELHQKLVAEVRGLMAHVGDTSNLILDPDLDSYYLMDAVLLKLPRGQDALGQLADLGEEVVARKAVSADDRTQLLIKSGLVAEATQGLNSPITGLPVAFRNDSTPGKTLQATLEPDLQGLTTATNGFLDRLRKRVLDAPQPTETPAAFATDAHVTLEASFKLWDAAVNALDGLLTKRIAQVTTAKYATLGGAAVAVVITLVLVFLLVRGMMRQIASINHAFQQIGIGNFHTRAAVVTNDELGRVAGVLNDFLLPLVQSHEDRERIQESITKLLQEVSGVADGDLTKEAEVTADITGAIADSFNYMIEQLRKIIGNVQEATLQVSTSASQIHETAEQLAEGSEAQAEQIINTSSAIDEMAASIQQVSENASMSAKVADQSLASARQGNEAVQNTIQGMNRIRDQVQETAKRIKRLGESSQEIGQIIQLIDDIADRTSILALNASIQAAMAGEAGRGFAVVAEEVERLAVRSTEATKKIATLVKTIQAETNEAVSAMEKGIHEVVEGSRLANQAGKALAEIESVSQRLAALIQTISDAAHQQARGSEELARSMGNISDITQKTAAGTRDAAAAVNNLASLADELRTSLSTFRLPASSGGFHGGGVPNGAGSRMSKRPSSAPVLGVR